MPPRSTNTKPLTSAGPDKQGYIMPQKKSEKIVIRTTLTLDCAKHSQLIEVITEAESMAYTIRELALIGLMAVLDSEDKYHE